MALEEPGEFLSAEGGVFGVDDFGAETEVAELAEGLGEVEAVLEGFFHAFSLCRFGGGRPALSALEFSEIDLWLRLTTMTLMVPPWCTPEGDTCNPSSTLGFGLAMLILDLSTSASVFRVLSSCETHELGLCMSTCILGLCILQ